MQTKIILLIFILFLGCDFKKNAVGNANTLVIFCSEEDRIFTKPVFNEFFSQTLELPQPEKRVELEWGDPIDFASQNNLHNMVVLSLQYPRDETGDELFHTLFKTLSDQDSMIAIMDLYNKDQILFGIFALDVQQLQSQLAENSEFIRSNLEENIHRSIMTTVFEKGKNSKLSAQVREWFGFDMFIQEDYKLIKEDPELPFTWIGRGYPYRWLTFHQIDLDSIPSPEITWKVVDALLESTLGNVEITKDFRSNEVLRLGGKKVPVLRGNYYHDESETGGPFFSMLFHKSDAKYLVISGFVNNPGHSKMPLIKQLEAIILDGKMVSGGKL